jgi:hypothetical protein
MTIGKEQIASNHHSMNTETVWKHNVPNVLLDALEARTINMVRVVGVLIFASLGVLQAGHHSRLFLIPREIAGAPFPPFT